MPEYQACSYCKEKRGHTRQHLITRNQARRNINAARHRSEARFIIPCCLDCNVRLGTRLRVPVGYTHKAALEAITGDVYGEWAGGSLEEVVRR